MEEMCLGKMKLITPKEMERKEFPRDAESEY